MFKRFSVNYLVLLFLIDAVIVQLSLLIAFRLRFIIPLGQVVLPDWIEEHIYVPNLSMHISIGLLWFTLFLFFSCYTPRRIILWFDEFQRLLLAHTVAALSLTGLLYLANIPLLRLVFAYFYVITLVMLIGYRVLLRLWHRFYHDSSASVARILVVGAGSIGRELVIEFERQQWPGIEFVGFLDNDRSKIGETVAGLPVLGTLEQVSQQIHQHNVDEVIVALPRDAHIDLVTLTRRLSELPVRLRVVPDYFDLAFHGATIENLGGFPLIGLRDPAIDEFQRFAKRLMDILLSFLGLVIVSPLLALIALLIKLEDNGPVLYTAYRVGENGRLFNMLKFRSMIVNAEQMQLTINHIDKESGDIHHKSPEDPRITKVGQFIRKTSLDELPQLINVLRGDMSLVGPRPELPWLVDDYELWQRKRFAVPQGITGWWQINGRSDNLMHLHTDQDLYYIQNYSLWLDIQILWRTIGVVLRGRGAY